MSDGPEGMKWMELGKANARFKDLTQHVRELVSTNEHGFGEFRCYGGSGPVWVEEWRG